MSDLREAAQQALEAWQTATYGHPSHHKATLLAMTALRAALVQQAEPKGGGNLPPPLQAEPAQEPGFWGRVAARQASRIKQLEITAQQARQAEPVREPVAWRLWDEDPQGGGDWRYYDAKDFKEGIDPMKYFDGLVPLYTTPPKAEPVQEPDLSRCPQYNGPADNGHDRSLPPNPYLCTKCMAEMPQPSYNVTVVDDAHPNGIPLEQWQNKPVQEPVAWMSDSDVGFEKSEFGATPTVPLYTAPPQRKPLSLTDLQEALVLTNLIDRDAIDDSEEYDEGSTLAQIDELYRIIKERI